MEIINLEELSFNEKDIFSSGSYGFIKKCFFNENIYAYKEFFNSNYLNGKKRLLNNLSEIKKEGLITPKFWIKKSNEIVGYLTDFCFGKDIDAYETYPTKDKIKLLKDTKNLILSMHDENIIHSDLIGSNIMISNNKPYIIDFDNSSFKTHKTNRSAVTDLAQSFIETYGIIKEIDIFIFNILTFSIINECDFYLCRKDINNNIYGFFDNNDSKKICESLFLNNKIPNKDFLIDTIDETKIII